MSFSSVSFLKLLRGGGCVVGKAAVSNQELTEGLDTWETRAREH